MVEALGDCESTTPAWERSDTAWRCLWTLKPAVVSALAAWVGVSPTTVGTGIIGGAFATTSATD